jgi:hypothetical protein
MSGSRIWQHCRCDLSFQTLLYLAFQLSILTQKSVRLKVRLQSNKTKFHKQIFKLGIGCLPRLALSLPPGIPTLREYNLAPVARIDPILPEQWERSELQFEFISMSSVPKLEKSPYICILPPRLTCVSGSLTW